MMKKLLYILFLFPLVMGTTYLTASDSDDDTPYTLKVKIFLLDVDPNKPPKHDATLDIEDVLWKETKISEIRKKIEMKMNNIKWGRDCCVIIHGGKMLEDGRTLSDYNIPKKEALILSAKSKDSYSLKASDSDDDTPYTLKVKIFLEDVDPNKPPKHDATLDIEGVQKETKISEIKEKVKMKMNNIKWGKDYCKFIREEKILEDGRTLSDYNIPKKEALCIYAKSKDDYSLNSSFLSKEKGVAIVVFFMLLAGIYYYYQQQKPVIEEQEKNKEKKNSK